MSLTQAQLELSLPPAAGTLSARIADVEARFVARGLAGFAFNATTTPQALAAFWEGSWALAQELEIEWQQERAPLRAALASAQAARDRRQVAALRERLTAGEQPVVYARERAFALVQAAQAELDERLTALARARGLPDPAAFCAQVQDCYTEPSWLEQTWTWPLTQVIENCLEDFRAGTTEL